MKIDKRYIIGILLILRLILVNSVWIRARTSFVYSIFVVLGSDTDNFQNFWIQLILYNVKVLAALLIEILFTTELKDNVLDLENNTKRRFIVANLLLLLAEFMVLVSLLLELNKIRNWAFVKALINSSSLFSLLMNESGYAVIWIGFIAYMGGMVAHLFPQTDSQQSSTDRSAIFLFLRSIFLPM